MAGRLCRFWVPGVDGGARQRRRNTGWRGAVGKYPAREARDSRGVEVYWAEESSSLADPARFFRHDA